MHYQQALALQPGNERATSGISYIDGPQVSDQQRTTYFISWSDAPPPQRKRSSGESCQTQISHEDAPVEAIIENSQNKNVSVLKKLSQWIRPV
jgi:hypothetical protein